MIESLLNSRPAWVQLGLVLAHFLWQGAAIAVVLAASLWLLRRRSPNTRYGLCGTAMLAMAVGPVLTLWYVRAHPLPILTEIGPAAVVSRTASPGDPGVSNSDPAGIANPAGESSPAGPLSSNRPVDAGPAEASGDGKSLALQAIGERGASKGNATNDPGRAAVSPTAGSIARRLLPRGLELAALAWLIGVATLSARLVVGWWRLRRQSRRDAEALPEAIEAIVRRLSGRLGLAQRVCVVAARAWGEPIAFGLFRPVVLMPISVLTQCPVELIEAMIAHELAHIRRYDLWANVLQRVVETVLFYHPAVWWVSGRMRLERELCCDDLAIYATGRRADYASALVELCRVRPGLVAPALAAGIFGPKLSLLTRVRRILQVSAKSREPNRGRFWLAGPLSILLAGAFAFVASLPTAPQSVAAIQPVATRPADPAQRPEEKKTYTFNWNRQPLSKVLTELQEKTSLSMPGADEIGPASGQTISFTSVRPVGFDEALLLVNHLLQDKGYWIVHRDQCLEIRRLEDWFRRIPPAHMFTSEEAYRKANLPKWDVASTVYQTQHATAKALADRAMDQVPDNTARAVVTPDGKRIELKGIVEYIEQQIEIIRKWDVPQDDSAAALVGKAGENAGRTHSFYGYGSRAGSPKDDLGASYSFYSAVSKAPSSSVPTSVPVHAGADGLIVEVKVKNGQTVKKGDLLARFDDEEIRIDLLAAEIRFDECSRTLGRIQDIEKTLSKEGRSSMVGREELNKAESAMRLAELDVRRCKLRLQRTQIMSPADGIVRGRGAPENDVALLANQQVKAGELLLYIQPAQQAGSTGTTAPKSHLGAAPKSATTTWPAEAAALAELLDGESPWLSRGPETAQLEKAIKDLQAAKEKLRMTDSHPRVMELRQRIEDWNKLLTQSAARKKVYAQADGVVAEVKVQDGQTVKKGDLLVQLDAAETELELLAAEVRLDQARTQLERLKKLREHSTVSEFEYQKAAADTKLAEIEINRIQLRLSRSRIKSPADGRVRSAEGNLSDLVGKRVVAGDLLLFVESVDSVSQADTRPSR